MKLNILGQTLKLQWNLQLFNIISPHLWKDTAELQFACLATHPSSSWSTKYCPLYTVKDIVYNWLWAGSASYIKIIFIIPHTHHVMTMIQNSDCFEGDKANRKDSFIYLFSYSMINWLFELNFFIVFQRFAVARVITTECLQKWLNIIAP